MFTSIYISKKYIFIQFFIIRNDILGRKFFNLLKNKSYKYIVIIVIDRIGTYANFENFNYFNSNIFQLNFRNHKKFVLLDNNIIILGGSNIGIEYLNMNLNIGFWNDFNMKLKSFIIINYYLETKKYFFNFCINNFYFFYNNTNYKFLLYIFINIKKNLILFSPYIILDINLIFLLKILFIKNIKIFIFFSLKTDNIITHLSSIIFYKFFYKKITFFFFKNVFDHRKVYIIDKIYFLFGSMNFDNRSIYLNLELILLIKNFYFVKNFLKKIKKKIFKNFFLRKKNFYLKILYLLSFLNYLNQ